MWLSPSPPPSLPRWARRPSLAIPIAIGFSLAAVGCSDGGGSGNESGGAGGAGSAVPNGASGGGGGTDGAGAQPGVDCDPQQQPALSVTLENAPGDCAALRVVGTRSGVETRLTCGAGSSAGECRCQGGTERGAWVVTYLEGDPPAAVANSGTVFVREADDGCAEVVQVTFTLRPRDEEPPPEVGDAGADSGAPAADAGA
jgi:hypothetical protein